MGIGALGGDVLREALRVMKKIALTQGQHAIVDDDNYEWLNQWKWFAAFDPSSGSFYAIRKQTVAYGGKVNIRMHREIMQASNGELVDHKNHNTLDNRKYNLRIVGSSGNAMNRLMRSDNSSGICGVSWHKHSKKWRAYISVCGNIKSLGYFHEKTEAIAARLSANNRHGYHANHGKCRHEVAHE